MESAMDFLESRPLVGFQMDGSHLLNVLQTIIQQQDQQLQFQRQVAQRLGELEDGVRDLNSRQSELERAIGANGTDALRKVRQRLEDIENDLHGLAREVKDVRVSSNEAGRAAEDAARDVQSIGRDLSPMQERLEHLHQEVDDLARDSVQQAKQMADAVKNMERSQDQQAKRYEELMRELGLRENSKDTVQKLRELLDDLSDRTDENFRSVEESARAVDAELGRHRAEINTARNEIGALDDKTRRSIAGVARDMDEKTQMILDILRNYEKSSLELEDHLAAAGQALARKRAEKEKQQQRLRENGLGRRGNGY